MRLAIHAGLHKTGTTSFQLSCREAAPELAESGVHYPLTSLTSSQVQFRDPHAAVADAVWRGEDEVVERWLRDTREEAAELGCETMLFSSESVSSLGFRLNRLNAFKQVVGAVFPNYEFILVIRPIRSLLASVLKQQLVHGGRSLLAGEEIKSQLLSIPAGIQAFVDGASPQIRICHFDELAGPTLCNRLLQFCCPELEDRDNPILQERHENTSSSFRRDLFSLLTPLLRSALSVKHDFANPYSMSVENELNRLIDRQKVNEVLNEGVDIDAIDALVRHAIDRVASSTLESEIGRLRRDFPQLDSLGLFDEKLKTGAA